jgi:phage gp36-like protein
MSSFISKDDYKYKMRTERLDQILEASDEDEETMLNSAEEEAIALIRKHLDNRYNMTVELSKSGADRNKVLLLYAKNLVIYLIYERIPDEMVPERIVKNYDDTLKALVRIEEGKAEIPGLTVIEQENSEGESEPYTRRRFGSEPRRTHDGTASRYYK